MTEINNAGDQILGTYPLTNMRGLQRISNGEYGQAEKDAWASGITCGYIDEKGCYNLCAGRRMIVLLPTGDFNGSRGEPHDISYYFPGLAESYYGFMNDRTPKAIWFNMGKVKRWGFVFQNLTITLWSNAPGYFLCWIACPEDEGTKDWTSWSAVANYLNSPWPWPRCPADQ